MTNPWSPTLEDAGKQLQAAVKAFAELSKIITSSMEQFTTSFKAFFKTASQIREEIAFQQHAFIPNYDLRCTYPGCDMTPEEH